MITIKEAISKKELTDYIKFPFSLYKENKYGAYANITTDTTFSVKTDVLNIDNRGISVFQIAEHYCNKNLVNRTIYNNQTITFDNTTIATNFNEHSNDLVITNSTRPEATTEIPLYNTIRPSFNDEKSGPSIFKPFFSHIIPYIFFRIKLWRIWR